MIQMLLAGHITYLRNFRCCSIFHVRCTSFLRRDITGVCIDVILEIGDRCVSRDCSQKSSLLLPAISAKESGNDWGAALFRDGSTSLNQVKLP